MPAIKNNIPKEKLFNLLLNNLNVVKQHPSVKFTPEFHGAIFCPICYKICNSPKSSRQCEDELTLEHVPPKALGGKVATLTCKSCNNLGGTELDSHLIKKIQSDLFFTGTPGAEMEAVFKPELTISLPSVVTIQPGNIFDIRYDPKRSNPSHIDKLHELESSDNIHNIKLTFLPKYKQNRADVALIRIAYLLAFARFGYGFLYNENLLLVRQQILDPSKKRLVDFGVMRADFPDSTVGISIIYEPKELKSFLVVFDLKLRERTTRYGVMLPGPTDPGNNIYEHIFEYKQKNDKDGIEHRIKVIPDEEFIRKPEFAFESHKYWFASCS